MELKSPSNNLRFCSNCPPIPPLSSPISSGFHCFFPARIGIGIRIRFRFSKWNRDNLSSTPRRCSPICSLSTHSYEGKSVDQAPRRTPRDTVLQVVLVSPQIPGNVGAIARTCAASAVGLHLVEPLGFLVDDAKLKRAGLDYWPYVVVKVHRSWLEFRDYFLRQEGQKRLLALTKRGTSIHSEFTYKRGDWLLFGSETKGLPPEALSDCQNEAYGGGLIRIPMVSTYVRCLNLSVSVGISVYEASRQLNYEQLLSSPESQMNDEQTYFKEDIYG